MKKQVSFEGHIFQDVSSARKPIYMLMDGDRNTVSLETKLADSGIVQTIAKRNPYGWMPKADFVAQTKSGYGCVPKDFIRDNLKKVKVTITIEEI